MIRSFTDLEVWREAHAFGLLLYKASSRFPASEQFGLTSQMRRAPVSITSNIAEGFGRSSNKDREHFYIMATGSVCEIESQLLFARDLGYITADDFTSLTAQLTVVHKLLRGLLRAHRQRDAYV